MKIEEQEIHVKYVPSLGFVGFAHATPAVENEKRETESNAWVYKRAGEEIVFPNFIEQITKIINEKKSLATNYEPSNSNKRNRRRRNRQQS